MVVAGMPMIRTIFLRCCPDAGDDNDFRRLIIIPADSMDRKDVSSSSCNKSFVVAQLHKE